jgi:uncharacterized membrane-anchored protein YjiN (DUF445 family)
MDSRLKEDRMAASLRRLTESALQRDRQQALLDEAVRKHKQNVLAAIAAGVSTRRVAEIGRLSPDTINRWKKQPSGSDTTS